MKSSSVLLAASAAAVAMTLSACDGLKEAMTAHIDTVARAGSQELTVDRLANLLHEAKMPPRKDLADFIANAWLDYQLLGQAAAKGDTTVPDAVIDSAAWSQIAGYKARRYYAEVSKNWGGAGDPVLARKMYDDGEVLAASHILILTNNVPQAQKAALKAKAEAIRAQATSANFADLAAKNSQDPGSAKMGGKLGLFARGRMVPQFEQAVLALKPGEISPVIETQFGYHIIRRATFDEVAPQLLQMSTMRAKQQAESSFVAGLEKGNDLQIRSDAAAAARGVVNDPEGHLKDGATLAASKVGAFTSGRFAKWLMTIQPMQLQQQRAAWQAAPDSVIKNVVRSFAINELVLKSADSAKMGPTPEELGQLRQAFRMSRTQTMAQLGVDPKSLADSAKTPEAREKLAAARINSYMDKLVTGQAQFVQVVQPVAAVMREQADAHVNNAGLDRALQKAVKEYAAADSSRRATQPASAVPMGPPGPAGAQGAVPSPTPEPPPTGAAPQPGNR